MCLSGTRRARTQAEEERERRQIDERDERKMAISGYQVSAVYSLDRSIIVYPRRSQHRDTATGK